MAHKRQPVPIWNKYMLQQKKTEHYLNLENLNKELFGERTKENGLFTQMEEKESILQVIREVIEFNNKHPEAVPFRVFPKGGWAFSYHASKKEAMEKLSADQSMFERDFEAVKTQYKLCVERQLELENKIRNYPTWQQVLDKNSQRQI